VNHSTENQTQVIAMNSSSIKVIYRLSIITFPG